MGQGGHRKGKRKHIDLNGNEKPTQDMKHLLWAMSFL